MFILTNMNNKSLKSHSTSILNFHMTRTLQCLTSANFLPSQGIANAANFSSGEMYAETEQKDKIQSAY